MDGENLEDIPKEKLSKGQLKKLKERQKKEAAAKAAADAAAAGEAPAETPQAAAAGGGGGKKGKKGGKPMNAVAAAALERQRLKAELEKQQEEEERRIREEEERIERERKEKEEAEKRKKEEAAAKREAKIQELKDKGEYMTKAQRAKKRKQDELRKKLIADGTIKPEDIDDEEKPKQSTMVRTKKDKNKNKDQQAEQQAKQEDKPTPAEKKAKIEDEDSQINTSKAKKSVKKPQEDEKEESDEVDDWENEDIDTMAEKGVKDMTDQIEKAKDTLQEDVIVNKEEEIAKQKSEVKNPKGGSKQQKKKDQEESKATFGDIQNDTADAKAKRKAEREARNKERLKQVQATRQKKAKMRCPIVCILGHVDTGKTLILDKLRKTNVQAGEAGGITQQIGATYFPKEYIEDMIDRTNNRIELDLQLPGFLVIDTPGHESFTNLRNRGSSLCDIAILVVDIVHALEQQTLESMDLLRQKKCPFIVALNKVDRIYNWKPNEFMNFRDSLEVQKDNCKTEFQDRCQYTILKFAEQGINTILYWNNEDVDEFISLCPTSAITGEGLPDLMTYLCWQCQNRIPKQLYEKNTFECTVLEAKVIDGHGMTIDVVLVNGVLNIQDTIVLQGMNGAIVTQIRALLTPQPMKELRVKAEYIHHKSIRGAMGIKIAAPGLSEAIAGSELLKASGQAEIDDAVKEIEDNMYDILDKYVDKNADGVCVQASTIGSLEALLEFLKESKIPVVNVAIGPVHKSHVQKAQKVLQQEDEKKIKKEFATILAFDVRVTPDAQEFADKEGIKIFPAKIIYHLFDEFTEYVKKCQEERANVGGKDAVFPCVLEIIPDAIFNKSDPIIIGINVMAGVLKIGTPLCVPDKENLRIGVIESMEKDRKPIQSVLPKDGPVSVRISGGNNVAFGRHFEASNQICSWITRKSIDSLKDFHREVMTKDDWLLVKKLKVMYKID